MLLTNLKEDFLSPTFLMFYEQVKPKFFFSAIKGESCIRVNSGRNECFTWISTIMYNRSCIPLGTGFTVSAASEWHE